MSTFKRISLLALVLLMCSFSFFMMQPHTAHATGTRQKLFILIPGFNTDTASPNGFDKILSTLNGKYPGSAALTYSYRGLTSDYVKLDTVVQSLDDDVNALTTYLTDASISNRDVYIIGHSLGGVIAAKYASQFNGFPSSDNARLAGIVALDSPIDGIIQNTDVATCYPQALAWISAAVGRQNLPIIGELTPGNAEVNQIQTASQHARILSIGSSDDCFIPPADTSINGGQNRVVQSGGTPGDIESVHGAVRQDDNAINLITSWIDDGDNSGGTPTPAPTNTPAPGGASCTTAPPLNNPTDGQTVDRGVTFSWNAPSTCTPGGYTFRINQSSDPEAQPWMVDTGWAPTSFSYTFNSDGTYYYHVRACGPCTPFNPGPWSNAQITVKAGSANGFQVCSGTNYGTPCEAFQYSNNSTCIPLDQVAGNNKSVRFIGNYVNSYNAIMYHDASCGTYLAQYGGGGYPDIGVGLYNQFSSMRLEKINNTNCSIDPNGNGVLLYRDGGFSTGGGCMLITSDVSDLGPSTFVGFSGLRFMGTYQYHYQVSVYTDANYGNLCGQFIVDQSDLRACAGKATSVKIAPYTFPPQAQNIAPSAILDHSGSGNVVDNDLSTEWVAGHNVPIGFVFPAPVTIQDVVVFDRAQSPTDNNQINTLELVFSDGTIINNIDMTSGGPRCAEVSFPAKQVSWVNVVPIDDSGNNGYREVQIWDTTGSVYSQNNCVMKFSLTPTPGSGPAPLVPVPSPVPTSTPTPTATPTATPAGSSTVFEDFTNGIGNWWTNGNVAAAQDNGNGIIRFTPAAQSSAEASKNVGTAALSGFDTITLRINLHGATLLGNDASALYLDQNGGWKYVSLSNYVNNGLDGWQTVSVPLTDFQGFDQTASFDRLGLRFWVSNDSMIDVDDITFTSNGGNASTPTPTSTPSPSPTPTATPTATPSPSPTGGIELLPSPWHLVGNNGAAELYQSVDPNILSGMNMVRITYNLHGLQALGGDASAIICDQNGWNYISLSDYGQNGLDGEQTVDIPLANFGIDLSQPVDGTIHVRFWYGDSFTVDITSIVVYHA